MRDLAQDKTKSVEIALTASQSCYYVATGIWSLVDIDSFEQVTGPKHDKWLVKTVGALITVIGGTLASAAIRREITPEIRLLAVASAAALAVVDVVYALQGRISKIYLVDAVAEAGLIGASALTGRHLPE